MRKANTHSNPILPALRWTARVWSLISMGVIVLFFVGEGFDPTRIELREWVGLLFFPAGVVVGMLVGWWREGLGGAITVASLAAFYGMYGLLIHGDLPGGWAFPLFAAPGFLFLLCGIRLRRIVAVIRYFAQIIAGLDQDDICVRPSPINRHR